MVLGKKGMEHWLIGLIIALVAFFVVMAGIKIFAQSAKIEEPICRMSVMMREALPSPDILVSEVKLFPLECSTQSINLPLEPYPKSADMTDAKKQEIVMKALAEEIAKCWWQFGEGTISKNIFGKTWGQTDKCFVCYKVKINDMPGVINIQELEHYLSTARYKVIVKTIGSTETTGKTQEECVAKGGKCEDGCTNGLQQVEWECLEGKKCCVDASMVVTYMDYIQLNGLLSISKDLQLEPKKDVYAITFASHTTRQSLTAYIPPVFVYDLLFNKPELPRIYVSRFNDVKDYCDVQE